MGGSAYVRRPCAGRHKGSAAKAGTGRATYQRLLTFNPLHLRRMVLNVPSIQPTLVSLVLCAVSPTQKSMVICVLLLLLNYLIRPKAKTCGRAGTGETTVSSHHLGKACLKSLFFCAYRLGRRRHLHRVSIPILQLSEDLPNRHGLAPPKHRRALQLKRNERTRCTIWPKTKKKTTC